MRSGVFRRIFDEDGDGIAGAVRQDDESQVVGPGEDASFVAVARAEEEEIIAAWQSGNQNPALGRFLAELNQKDPPY